MMENIQNIINKKVGQTCKKWENPAWNSLGNCWILQISQLKAVSQLVKFALMMTSWLSSATAWKEKQHMNDTLCNGNADEKYICKTIIINGWAGM